jgi:hypothetical protein|tara:strand:- start:1068 stop:2573 length:1506 start_codon:yes stop_codon:yes gene_type:complete
MSDYIKNVIRAAGGYAAPEEVLETEIPEGYHRMPDGEIMKDSEHDNDAAVAADVEDGSEELPEGFHRMPDGEIMRDDAHSIQSSMGDSGYLIPEEQDLADALLEIVEKHGKFNADNTGVWAGYNSAEENAENAAIGVKCGNCVFWEAPNGCKITVNVTEEEGLCRFAILPDYTVTAAAGSKPAPKKDQVKGSSKNAKGSASSSGTVKFSATVIKALQNKADEHNEKHGDTASKKTSVRTLKAVYRRGAGAFSTGYRPGQNRNSWAMARVNAFLVILRTGSPKNSKYTTDNDLLPSAHRRSSKSSASAITAAMGKDSGDPCWKGYNQVGMKKKNGKKVPNCVPSAASIDYVVDTSNATFGDSRYVSREDAYEVARSAFEKYSYLPDEELASAIMWEVFNLVEYSTTGNAPEGAAIEEFTDYLPEGHPDLESSIISSAAWVAGAPEIANSSRDVLIGMFSESPDEVESLHASTRLKVLVASGSLSDDTLIRLSQLTIRYAKVD